MKILTLVIYITLLFAQLFRAAIKPVGRREKVLWSAFILDFTILAMALSICNQFWLATSAYVVNALIEGSYLFVLTKGKGK